MPKEQPTVEELLKTPEGAQALSKVWRENAEKATDLTEKEQWTKAADDAWKTYLGLSNKAFDERMKKSGLVNAARSARRGMQDAKREAKAAGADDKVMSALDAIMAPLDIIAPPKKKA